MWRVSDNRLTPDFFKIKMRNHPIPIKIHRQSQLGLRTVGRASRDYSGMAESSSGSPLSCMAETTSRDQRSREVRMAST